MHLQTEALNNKYSLMEPQQRIASLFEDFENILFTTSFGTSSAVLLHLISVAKPAHPVYFIDTQYHFAETIKYKEQLSDLLGIIIISLLPDAEKNRITTHERMWETDPDHCCAVNKTEPMEKVKKGMQVWVSGLLSWQNNHRNDLNIFERSGDIIKFYPLIDKDKSWLENYFSEFNLPAHPLLKEGYESIGCTNCTAKGSGRQGRWPGLNKTECGLHFPKS